MVRSDYAIFCALLLLGWAQAGWSQSPAARDQSAEACPATLAKVREQCGCQPREAAAFNFLKQTKVNAENLRSQVRDCFMLDGSLNVSRLKVNAQGELTGCLSKVEKQYPEYRQVLADLVKAALTVQQRELDIWLDCYARELGQGGPATSGAPSQGAQRAAGGSTPTAKPPASGAGSRIKQDVKATGGARVKTGEVDASIGGTSRGSIQQEAKADGQGSVVETGPIKARIEP